MQAKKMLSKHIHAALNYAPIMSEYDLTHHNTLALQSATSSLCRLKTKADLNVVLKRALESPFRLVLGGGSNVVLWPEIKRLVIKVETRGIAIVEETNTHRIIEVAAGETWHEVVEHCVRNGWGGIENLALIPGTAGAAPVQNIGAYGVELESVLHSLVAVDLTTGQTYDLSKDECGFSYRDSMFKQAGLGSWLITHIRLSLPINWQPVLEYPDLKLDKGLQKLGSKLTPYDVFESVCNIRRSKLPDPSLQPNAGSFFKNPVIGYEAYEKLLRDYPDIVSYPLSDGKVKLAAGWLIQQCGWRGKRLGPVGMHTRQALVMVNYGGASADDVTALANSIKADVMQNFGVSLEQEPVNIY